MTADADKPRQRAPGGGRKPLLAAPLEATVKVRLSARVTEAWGGETRGALSANIRHVLMDVADGDALVMSVDDYEHLVVAPWLAARLAEVQALDLDDTRLEDWLSALLDQKGAAFRKRHANDNAAPSREGE